MVYALLGGHGGRVAEVLFNEGRRLSVCGLLLYTVAVAGAASNLGITNSCVITGAAYSIEASYIMLSLTAKIILCFGIIYENFYHAELDLCRLNPQDARGGIVVQHKLP